MLLNKRDITRLDVSRMFSMLDWCYHRGVEDAFKCGDIMIVKEYLNTERDYADWAMLGQDYEVCWQEYLLMLIHRAARTNWKGYLRRYFDSINRYGSSYLSCFIPLTLRWYQRGLRDYIQAPEASDYLIFKDRNRVYWSPKGIINVQPVQYVEEMQYAAYEFERRDSEIWESHTEAVARRKGAMNPTYYKTFRTVVKLAAVHKRNWF